MYVHFGQRPYGKCDVVPELFYVATLFFHINFVPLVPLGTRLVLGKQGTNYQFVHIPFSAKSLFYAWTRIGTFVGMGFALAAATTARNGKLQWDREAQVALLLSIFFAILYAYLMIYPRRKMPSYERACRLAQHAALDDRGWAALNILYGRDPFDRPTPADAFVVR